MTIPSGYFFRFPYFYKADESGPYSYDANTQTFNLLGTGGGGGGGGGAVTVANGADSTQGAIADPLVAAGAEGTVSSKLRRATQQLQDVITALGNLGTITVVTPGTAATNLGKLEDAAHNTGDVGVMSLAVRRDAPTSGASASGDYATLNLTSNGGLRTNTIPEPASVTNITLATALPGTSFAVFGSNACAALLISNVEAGSVDIEVQRGGAGATIIVPAGAERVFIGISNSNQLGIRRYDQASTSVTVRAEVIAQ